MGRESGIKRAKEGSLILLLPVSIHFLPSLPPIVLSIPLPIVPSFSLSHSLVLRFSFLPRSLPLRVSPKFTPHGLSLIPPNPFLPSSCFCSSSSVVPLRLSCMPLNNRCQWNPVPTPAPAPASVRSAVRAHTQTHSTHGRDECFYFVKKIYIYSLCLGQERTAAGRRLPWQAAPKTSPSQHPYGRQSPSVAALRRCRLADPLSQTLRRVL